MLTLIVGVLLILLLLGCILYFSLNLSVVGLVIFGGLLSVAVILVSQLDIHHHYTTGHPKVALTTLSIPLLVSFGLVMIYSIHNYAKTNSRDVMYIVGIILTISVLVTISGVLIYFTN